MIYSFLVFCTCFFVADLAAPQIDNDTGLAAQSTDNDTILTAQSTDNDVTLFSLKVCAIAYALAQEESSGSSSENTLFVSTGTYKEIT